MVRSAHKKAKRKPHPLGHVVRRVTKPSRRVVPQPARTRRRARGVPIHARRAIKRTPPERPITPLPPTLRRPVPGSLTLRPGLRKGILQRSRPKLQPTKTKIIKTAGISYSQGQIKINIEQTDSFKIPVSNGPIHQGAPRALRIKPPYARISTSALNGFSAKSSQYGTANYDEFYIGSVDVMYQLPNKSMFYFGEGIVMKQTGTTDRYVAMPMEHSSMTFQNGIPLGIKLEMSQDLAISASKGPIIKGVPQPVTLFAPYVQMMSGDTTKGFAAGKANSDSFFVGSVKVGNTFYEKAIVMQESPSTDKYVVIPIQK
jgi:hypothetical protein